MITGKFSLNRPQNKAGAVVNLAPDSIRIPGLCPQVVV